MGQISNKFLNVTLTMFVFFLSKLQESAYKPVYAAICTDGKVRLMSNMTTGEAQMGCVIVLCTFTNSAV